MLLLRTKLRIIEKALREYFVFFFFFFLSK